MSLRSRIRTQSSLFVATLCVLLASSSGASVPGQVNYQGLLLDDQGTPIDGMVAMTFTLFDADTGGTPLWTESHATVAVVEGVYEVALGSLTPLDATVLQGAALYLEVVVDGDTLAPRQRLLAVPFALRAQVADAASSMDGIPGEFVSQLFLHTNFDGGPPNDSPEEGFADTDGDTILNFIDADNDNDGLTDVEEVAAGSDINLVTPTITGFAPEPAGATTTTTVTISGTFFDPGMSVSFGSESPAPYNVTSSSALVDVGPQPPTSTGVTVTLPNGETGSGSFEFECFPSLTSLSPNVVRSGVPTLVSVTGTNLDPGYSVTVDGVPQTPINQTPTGFDVNVNVTGAGSTLLLISYPVGCQAGRSLQIDTFKAFVTSTVHTGDLGGLAGADAICQAQASAAGLDNPSTFLAWLSDGTTDPDARFSRTALPLQLTDGTPIATDWADLTDGTLLAPINRTANGGVVGSGNVWTNTAADGTNAGSGDCSGWTSTTGGGGQGDLNATDSTWTDNGTRVCGNPFRIYCLEQ